MQQCLEVEAVDFLKKPISYKKIQHILNTAYHKKLINASEKLMLKTQDGIIALQISDILYLKTENKSVVIHTVGRNIVTHKKLYDFEKILDHNLFYRCHQGYIVNLDYVEKIQDDYLVLVGNSIVYVPISKSRKDILHKKIAKFVIFQLN